MHRAIKDEITEAREQMKKEDFWQKSRAEADKRARLRTLELEAALARQ